MAKKSCFMGIYTIIILLSHNLMAAELDDHPRWGIAASLQGMHGDLIFPVLISSQTALIPSVSLLWVEDTGFDWSVQIGLRRYAATKLPIYPYFGLWVGTLGYSPESEETIFDYLVGLSAGGEYFLRPQFSLGIEAQLNFTKSDEESSRFGNPGGSNINTATVVIASLYLK